MARALSREKENSRRVTTEKMLLQKEVEKLNFENTFLRLKLSNLVWKLYCFDLCITLLRVETLTMFFDSSPKELLKVSVPWKSMLKDRHLLVVE